jgi:asparagine synthetase B (glutamine-hydrolysing)
MSRLIEVEPARPESAAPVQGRVDPARASERASVSPSIHRTTLSHRIVHGPGTSATAGGTILFGGGRPGERLAAKPIAAPLGDQPLAELAADGGSMTVTLPPASTLQLFVRHRPDRLILATDPGSAAGSERAIEPSAVFSLLQYGTVVPPLSIWRGVSRIEPGIEHRFDWSGGTIRHSERPLGFFSGNSGSAGSIGTLSTDAGPTMGMDDPVEAIAAQLDADLRADCPDGRPLILFSGGVDSGLLAARCRHLGMTEALLLHYSFGPDDPETRVARTMAETIGLPLEVVTDDPADLAVMMDRIPRDYPSPFSDHSALPTWRLMRRARDMGGERRTVVEGVGADSTFGGFEKIARWRSLTRIPQPLARSLGRLYGVGGVWHRRNGIEYRLRLLRRIGFIPAIPGPPIAQNALAGILYRVPDEAQAAVHQSLASWMKRAAPELDPTQRMILGLLMHHCGDVFSQKVEPLLDGSGLTTSHPFLSPACLRLALLEGARWPAQREKKERLKALLERSVPRELVHRKKSGFVAPMEKVFERAEFQDRLRQALRPNAPLAPWLNRARLLRVADLAAARVALPDQLNYFLWNVAFASIWLDGQRGD